MFCPFYRKLTLNGLLHATNVDSGLVYHPDALKFILCSRGVQGRNCGQPTCGDTVVHDAQAMHTNLLSSCFDVLQLILSLHSYVLDLAHRLVNVRDLGLLSCLDTLCCHLQQKCRLQSKKDFYVLLPMPAKQPTLMQIQMILT